jgi:ribonucleotide monophosphatase NagD (HAD superfamily)
VALAEADVVLGRACPRSRVLALGDGLATDIAGAQAMGLDRIFVTGGIHAGEADAPGGRLDAGAVEQLLSHAGLGAQYAMARLCW